MENNISFGARFLRTIPIKKYSYENKIYKPANENFVELSPFDLNDVKSLDNIAREFGGDTYVNNVYMDAKMAYNRNNPETEDIGLFILTRQHCNYNTLNPDEVLGVAEISKFDNSEIELDYLQVHPQYVYSFGPPFIKRIGSAILDCLKEAYKKIIVRSAPSATLFYKKNGFERVKEGTNLFHWERSSN